MHGNGICRLLAVPLLALGAAALSTSGQESEAGQETAALPASLAGFADEGVFDIYVNEEPIVRIDFTWNADGAYRGHTVISMAGQTREIDLEIEVDGEGRWTRITQSAATGKGVLERDGSAVRRTIKDETVTVDIKPGVTIFDNYSPVFVRQSIAAYDQQAGGKQTLPVLFVPGVVRDIELERLDKVARVVGARDVEFTRYRYGAPGVDITVWVDPEGKVCLADVPAQHAAYVRQGYEALRKTEPDDPTLSRPEHDVEVDKDVRVPMRDGVWLATDVYRPAAEGRYPVVLVRTPYQKNMSELQGRYYARRGYVTAIQDCRGRFGSEGDWEPFVNEAKDGYDTIEWLAGQPWSNGKVGMIGGSYLGWVQWWAASENPPHLTTIIPNVAPPDPFYNIPYEYGVHFLLGAIWWADVLESEATADLSGVALQKVMEKEYAKLLQSLPVIDLDEKVLGKKSTYWRTWIAHPTFDEYWERAAHLDKLKDVRIPVFHQSGWFDGDGIGSKLNYLKMRSFGHDHQKLVLGPWGHSDQAHRMPDHDFGPAAIIDLQTLYLRWFDHWLKGVDNGVPQEPLVKIFVMGANEWLEGDVYPLPQTKFEKWYLNSDGNANTTAGDGTLSTALPAADALPDSYTYDPGDPTPTPDFYVPAESGEDTDETEADSSSGSGTARRGEREGADEVAGESPPADDEPVKTADQLKAEREAHHARVTAERKDILVYTSAPLAQPLTIAGPMSARIYASSSAKDTDWFVRIMEVDKDGKIFQLAEGKIRARFRESLRVPKLLDPGETYAYDIDLWQTGIRFPAGSRIRVEVASASFPMFSRNLNTGGHNETETEFVSAAQKIHHDAEHASYVLLPVIPVDSPDEASK